MASLQRLFPGKYDTFFTREDGWVERFLRDKSGKVTGILYTHADGELEAKRVPWRSRPQRSWADERLYRRPPGIGS